MKLPYIVDTLISPKITGFNFIDRYAGVVRTINIAVQDQNDKSMVKRFPVACNIISPDCANPAKHTQHLSLIHI